MKLTVLLLIGLGLLGYFSLLYATDDPPAPGGTGTAPEPERIGVATFAGGCFWCMEPPFDKLDGVLSSTSGYIGGPEPDPTYEQVSSGKTGHAEAVQIRYDRDRISYPELLDVFWRNINPTTPDRQFVDVGPQYRSAIFYHDETQREQAEASRAAMAQSGRFGPKDIVTEIVPATEFYPAEEYHQDYYQKNPLRYKFYRRMSGRDQYLNEVWGKQEKE